MGDLRFGPTDRIPPTARRIARRAPLLVAAALASTSCAMGTELPSDPELAAFNEASAATLSLQQLGALADNLFGFGFVIDPRATDAGNAMNIQLDLQSRLQGCGTVTASGAQVNVDFTTAGCPVRNGTRISGTVTLTVMRIGPDTVIATSFPSISVDGFAIAGMVSFSTASGSRFAASGTVTGGGVTLTIGDRTITYDGSVTTFSIDGGVSINNGASTTSATITGVNYTLGDCYVHSGTTAITTSAGTETLTFDAQTASTGTVSLAQGDRTFSLSLLTHGSCAMH